MQHIPAGRRARELEGVIWRERERNRETGCVSECVCVCERERVCEGQRERDRDLLTSELRERADVGALVVQRERQSVKLPEPTRGDYSKKSRT